MTSGLGVCYAMGAMAKNVQTDPTTGLLQYRRAYPAKLRPYVPGGARELKRALRSKSLSDPEASRIYSEAQAEFERMVKLAKLKADASTGGVPEDHTADPLFPELITFLADSYYAAELARDEAEAWGKPTKPTPYAIRENPERDWEVSREILEQRKREKLWSYWRDWTLSYCAAMGYKVSPRDPLLGDLLKAIAEAACGLWLALDSRIDEQIGEGTAIDTPPAPERPSRSRGATSSPAPAAKGPSDTLPELLERLVEANTGRKVRPSTVQGWRSAVRFWTEAHGPIGWQDITRAKVTEFLELVSQRPARIPKNKDKVPLPKLVASYAGREDVQRLSGKTVEQHLISLSALWTRSERRGWIEGKPNPFTNHEVSVAKKAGGNPLSPEELKAIFSLPVFTKGERPTRGRGEAAFWIPLFALCTGARPGEIAQLLVSDFTQAEGGRWMMT